MLLLASLLAACSSTVPAPALTVATTTPVQRLTSSATSTPVARTSDGPVTPSMARFELDGERFAALGDPDAPVTLIEFSDYG